MFLSSYSGLQKTVSTILITSHLLVLNSQKPSYKHVSYVDYVNMYNFRLCLSGMSLLLELGKFISGKFLG